MKVAILDRVVRQNILLFKQLLQRQRKKIEQHKVKTAEKVYAAFINRNTGEIHFEELEREKDSFLSKDWKPINIQLRISDLEDQNYFEIVAAKPETEVFEYIDLKPKAYHIMAETIHLLNALSSNTFKTKNPEKVIEEITILEIEAPREEKKRNLIYEAWHQCDRMGAERLLKDQPIGTYLFRKDEYASWLEEKLQEELKKKITCITLTYNCNDKKICDKTIVSKDDQWLVYDDDPKLEEVSYASIEDLLNSFENEVKTPLKAF